MTTRPNTHASTLGKGLYFVFICLLVAFCGNVSAETINRKAVRVWKRGYLEMYEAGERLKKGDDRDALNQYILASKYFEEVREKYPKFEPEMVMSRLNDCYVIIDDIRARHPNDIFFAPLGDKDHRIKQLTNENERLSIENKKLERDYTAVFNELRNSTESAMLNRMITAARRFDQLLKDDRVSPTSADDANARYKLYASRVRELRDFLYPDNYVIGGIVNGVWMLDPGTGEPIFYKPEDLKKRGLPAVLFQ